MDRFEKHALDIIKRGDEILNQKRKRSRIIRNTAFSLSGVCAVFIVGFGIVHNKELFESVRKPIPDKVIVNEITTETKAYTTTNSQADISIVTTENSITVNTTSSVTTTGGADIQNPSATHYVNTQSAVSYTKTDTVITTNSYTTTAVVVTAPQAITTNATTTEEKISCTVSLSTQTTTFMTTTTIETVLTFENTVNTTNVQTRPTTVQATAIVTTTTSPDRPTTAQPTAVVTTIPTGLPENPPAEINNRFEWQGVNFIKTPYYSEKDNALDYLGNVGDNQLYSYDNYNTYVVVLMLTDDKYVICVNETYYEDFMKDYEEVKDEKTDFKCSYSGSYGFYSNAVYGKCNGYKP